MKGLNPSVGAYPSRLDAEVAHGGKQSLRISHVATPVDPKAVDPKIAAVEWSKVLEHLEGSREQYARQQAAARDIEWAIQNARVVLQVHADARQPDHARRRHGRQCEMDP